MTVNNRMNPSMRPAKPRLTGAERRAAEIAAAAGKQAQLKREAAERRADRARRDAETPPRPLKTVTRRPRPR